MSGWGPLRAGCPNPGAPQPSPRAPPCAPECTPPPPPQKGARSPGRTGPQRAGGRAAAWARPLTSGRARRQQSPGQGEQEGAGGGRGRRARCHRRRPSVQRQLSGWAAGAAPSPAGAWQGPGVATRGDFLPQGGSSEPPRAAPGPRKSSSRLSFF